MGSESGGFPVNYLRYETPGITDAESERMRVILGDNGLVATLARDPFPGQVARVRIDAFGESASEVEQTLREYAGRCDAATQSAECSYGQFVIERNLEIEDGDLYSWKGRMTLHPGIGREPFVPAGRLRAGLDA